MNGSNSTVWQVSQGRNQTALGFLLQNPYLAFTYDDILAVQRESERGEGGEWIEREREEREEREEPEPPANHPGATEGPSGVIPWSFLEPLGRSWSHFVSIYCQKLTKSLGN